MDILPARPPGASQIRCHLSVQQTLAAQVVISSFRMTQAPGPAYLASWVVKTACARQMIDWYGSFSAPMSCRPNDGSAACSPGRDPACGHRVARFVIDRRHLRNQRRDEKTRHSVDFCIGSGHAQDVLHHRCEQRTRPRPCARCAGSRPHRHRHGAQDRRFSPFRSTGREGPRPDPRRHRPRGGHRHRRRSRSVHRAYRCPDRQCRLRIGRRLRGDAAVGGARAV